MSKTRHPALAIVMAILSVSCIAQTPDQTTTEVIKSPSAVIDQTATSQVSSSTVPITWSILHLDICTPPCWLGITPGETKGSEARRILENHYQLEEVNWEADTVFARWKLIQETSMPKSTIIIKHGLVESINLRVSVGHFNVNDIMSHFGEPDVVVWTAAESRSPENSCGENMELSYFDKNMIVVLPTDSSIVSITPTTPITAIVLQAVFSPSDDWSPPIKWAGYEGEYCPPGGRH